MTTTAANYGEYFAEMIETNVDDLMQRGPVRERNSGAPFVFGENHFRKHMRAYKPPTHWPRLVIDRRVQNDIQGHGGVDYCFLSSSSSKPDISDVLATCEVKGPTRPALLRGSKENWYPDIVRDIKKQVGRATIAPDAQHYLGLMIVPPPDSDVRRELAAVFAEMLREVPQAKLIECSWTDLKGLHIVVYRVVRSAAIDSPNDAPQSAL